MICEAAMEILKGLEKEYGFTYPELYYKLHSDGMLEPYAAKEADAIDEFEIGTNQSLAEKLKNQSGVIPFLSAISIIRVLPVDRIRYRLTESYIGENIDRTHKLIPFAIDSAGAWYAFLFRQQKGGDVPVALVWDDCDEVVVLAKNLEDFIFLQMLEAAAVIYSDVDLEQRRKELLDMVATHAPYLSSKYIELLNEVYGREFFSTFHQPSEHYSYTSWHLIGNEELKRLKKELLDFELMGETFQWLRE